MPEYRIVAFRDDLTLPAGERVIAADVQPPNERQRSFALVELPPDDEDYVCGAELSDGECGRSVSGPDERCWQHEDNE